MRINNYKVKLLEKTWGTDIDNIIRIGLSYKAEVDSVRRKLTAQFQEFKNRVESDANNKVVDILKEIAITQSTGQRIQPRVYNYERSII